MAAKKQIQFNFVETACTGNQLFIGSWKEGPEERSRSKDRLPFYLELAKLAERGKVTSVFFADTYGANDVYAGNTDATYRGGCQVAQLDPFMIISAMASVTKSVGFTVSANVVYLNPYTLARSLASLDHLTDGRVGWNIVTGYTNASARAFGFDTVMGHDERYLKAEEFVDLTYRLWEGSWDDDAQVWDVERDIAYDPTRIQTVEFSGKFHKLYAAQQTHPSPQRVPVLFQAGSSKPGIKLASENAEGVFCGSLAPERSKAYIADVRAAAKVAGRDGEAIKAFPGLCTFIGRTMEEAQAKYDLAVSLASPEAGLAKFGGYTGIDLSKYPMDEPFDFNSSFPDANAIRGIILGFSAGSGNTEEWTPRKIGVKMSLGSMYPIVVGTAETVADFMEKWMDETDADGFSLFAAKFPETYEDVVDILVPELQKRGRYWLDYPFPGKSLRENMTRVSGATRLPDDHPAVKYRREREERRALRAAAATK